MKNRFLGVQILLIWVVFAIKTVTLLWQPVKARILQESVTPVQQFVGETCANPIMITKGPR